MNRKIHPHVEFADGLRSYPDMTLKSVRFFTEEQCRKVFPNEDMPKKSEVLVVMHNSELPLSDIHRVPIIKGNAIRYVVRYFARS